MNEKLETNGLIQTEPVSQFSDRTIDPISAEMSDGDNIKQYSSIPTVRAKSAPGMAAKEADDKLTVETSYNGRIRPGVVVVAVMLILSNAPTISFLLGVITSSLLGARSYAYLLTSGNWYAYVSYTISVLGFTAAIGLLLRHRQSLTTALVSLSAYSAFNIFLLINYSLKPEYQLPTATSFNLSFFYGLFIVVHIVAYVFAGIYLLRPKVRAIFY